MMRVAEFPDAFLDAMNRCRIGTGVHYLSVPEHAYYQQRCGWKPEAWPNAMRLGRQTVSLPPSPKLTNLDVERMIYTVQQSSGSKSARGRLDCKAGLI